MSNSRWHKAAEGVQALLQTALSGLASPDNLATNRIVIKERPNRLESDPKEGVFLFPVDETATPATHIQDDEGHGVGVVIFRISNQSPSVDDRLHYWADTAKQAARLKRIASADVHRTEIEPRALLDPSAFGQNYNIASFTVRCFIRTT